MVTTTFKESMYLRGSCPSNTEIRWIIFFAAKEEALYSQQNQDRGAACGSDHELLIAKFRLKESRENH